MMIAPSRRNRSGNGQRLSVRQHDGFNATELVVAATLLVSVISVVAPLAVRSGRLWQDSWHYRVALDEACNQLERLTSLETAARIAALDELTPTDHARQALPNATLTAETVSDADGSRVIMRINWDRSGAATPLTLIAWIDPLPVAADAAFEEDRGP